MKPTSSAVRSAALLSFLLGLMAYVAPIQAQLPPNGSVSGSLNATTTQITYSFVPPADGDGTFTITPSAGLQANIQFFDSDGVTYRGESPVNGIGASSAFTITHLGPGAIYFFRALRRNGAGTFTLSNVYTSNAIVNDVENNDSSVNALPVAMPATRTGHLGYSRVHYNDVDLYDWYKFTVPADGNLILTVTPASTLQANIQFFDSDGATYRGESPVHGVGVASTFTITHLSPGAIYFLRILQRNGYGSYTLTSTFAPAFYSNDSENNDSFAVALGVAMPAVRTGHLGYSRAHYGSVDSEDWYRFTVPQDGDLTVSIAPTPSLQANLQFFDFDGATYRGESPVQQSGETSVFTIPHLGPTAIYFLRGLLRSGYGSYVMEGRFRPQYVVNDAESNDASANAISIASFVGQTGHLGYSRVGFYDIDSQDWYRFSHPGGPLTVTLVNSAGLQANLVLYAYDGATYLGESPVAGVGEPSTLSTTRDAGIYFMRVLQRSGYGAYGLNPQGNIAIFGNITLEDCLITPQTVTIEIRPESGAPMSFNVTNGAFSLPDLPRQNYSVAFKGAKWLRRTEVVDSQIGDVFIVNAFLLAGDADDDNEVTVLDLDILLQTFDKCEGDAGYDGRADLNCDGCADVLDLDLVLRNFDKLGDD